ncbi:hypothetical protein [Streptomyces mirabilis]|uniref:hypothetical protein n=1 Tax=Streptomyces mirabilis TaxID=68239 RepID=UPI0022558504|nr:hypothetical protein [Streptomyces mirabilis]MCX4426064.1 hypothetical protein [Streptomyces mirabilis]
MDGGSKRPARLMMYDLDSTVDGPEVGRYDLFNHGFAVQSASRPYVLVGTDLDKPHKDKWIAAVGADGTLRRPFPHSWVPQEHHFGGRRSRSGSPWCTPAPSTMGMGSNLVAPTSYGDP